MTPPPIDRARRATLKGLSLIAAAPFATAACGGQAGETPGAAADATAFVDVTVLPMDSERTLPNQTVVTSGGRIASIGPAAAAAVPEGVRRVDGRGRYLMPGLAEMHGHVPGGNEPAYAQDVLFLYVANGVTTVRNMAGDPFHLTLRDRIASVDVMGPTLIAASPWMGDETAEAARETVAQRRRQGFDLLKVGDMPRPAYAAMAEAANAAGMPFAGHIPQAVGLTGALDVRQASIDHLDRYVEYLVAEAPEGDPGFFGSAWVDRVDEGRIAEAVERTIAAGTWNVPTLSLVEHLASPEPAEAMIAWPEMRYMPARVREGWVRSKGEFAARPDFQPEATAKLVALRQRILMALHRAGAPIALGSDAPQFFNVPGFSIHREMAMMQAAGMTPFEVLASGTRAPAVALGTPDGFGTVAAGRRADLILLSANPLEDLGAVRERVGVMVRGRWLPEAQIQVQLAGIRARMAAK